MQMNDEIREKVRATLKAKKLSQEKAAELIGVKRVYLNKMLNQKVATVPESWQKLFQVAGLKLILVEDDAPTPPPEPEQS